MASSRYLADDVLSSIFAEEESYDDSLDQLANQLDKLVNNNNNNNTVMSSIRTLLNKIIPTVIVKVETIGDEDTDTSSDENYHNGHLAEEHCVADPEGHHLAEQHSEVEELLMAELAHVAEELQGPEEYPIVEGHHVTEVVHQGPIL